MFVIGITGGIASGKSTLTEYLASSASAVIDADKVARDVIAPDTPAYKSLIERFGPEIIDENREINRHELGRLVFSDNSNVDFINHLTHPEIVKRIRDKLERLRQTVKPDDIVLLRVPLMAETGLHDLADMIVVVTADEKTRISRAVARTGSSATETSRVIAAQAQDSERVKIADIVIENSGSLDELAEGACRVLVEAGRRIQGKA